MTFITLIENMFQDKNTLINNGDGTIP